MRAALPSRKRSVPTPEQAPPQVRSGVVEVDLHNNEIWDKATIDFASGVMQESLESLPSPSLGEQPCRPLTDLTPPSFRDLEPVLRTRFSRLRERLGVQSELRRRDRAGQPPPKRRRGQLPPVRMTERELCRDVDELEHTLLWLALLDCTRALVLSGQDEARRHPEFTRKMRSTMERAKKALMMTYGCRYSQ